MYMNPISMEKSGLKGEFEIKLFGPDGLLKDYRLIKNLTLTVGFDEVCHMMADPSYRPPAFEYCGVGTGTVAPAVGDSTLGAELTIGLSSRIVAGFTQSSATIWKNDATFGAGTCTGAITESGLFNSSALGGQTMLCRQTFPVINKGESDTLVVTWQYTLS